MNKELQKELVTPPRALIRTNPVLWLRFFGPGAIVASLTLGSGETLFASRVTPAAIYTGVLTCGFYCLANPWMDWRFLPVALRMSGWLVFANVMAGWIFLIVGLKALWDYGQFGSYLTLAALLVARIILASQLKFLQRRGANSPDTVA